LAEKPGYIIVTVVCLGVKKQVEIEVYAEEEKRRKNRMTVTLPRKKKSSSKVENEDHGIALAANPEPVLAHVNLPYLLEAWFGEREISVS